MCFAVDFQAHNVFVRLQTHMFVFQVVWEDLTHGDFVEEVHEVFVLHEEDAVVPVFLLGCFNQVCGPIQVVVCPATFPLPLAPRVAQFYELEALEVCLVFKLDLLTQLVKVIHVDQGICVALDQTLRLNVWISRGTGAHTVAEFVILVECLEIHQFQLLLRGIFASFVFESGVARECPE